MSEVADRNIDQYPDSISREFQEIVERLVDIVMSGTSTVDGLVFNADISVEDQNRLREAVRQRVADGSGEVEAREVKKLGDVVGGMTDGENKGGYRFVSIGMKKFVGDPEETASSVRECLEREAAKDVDLDRAEVEKLMEIVQRYRGHSADELIKTILA